MNRAAIFALALGAGGILGSSAQPVRAEQPAATQADIAGKLYPSPKAYQGEARGIPAVGSLSQSSRPDSNVQHVNLGRHLGAPATQPPPAADLGAPAGCPALPQPVNKPSVSLPQITFDFGSAQLRPEAIETLRNLGKALNEQLKDQSLFTIEGHTDAVGNFEQNDELSLSRAEAVRRFLVREMGVAQNRLGIVGKSYCEPADPQHPYDASNRRVVVTNQS